MLVVVSHILFGTGGPGNQVEATSCQSHDGKSAEKRARQLFSDSPERQGHNDCGLRLCRRRFEGGPRLDAAKFWALFGRF